MEKNFYFIPLAIIIAGAVIGGGLAFGLVNIGGGSGSPNAGQGVADVQPTSSEDTPGPSEIRLAEVTENDHIRGDINAPITIVEYSDLECPFCQRFHGTMQQIIDNYPGEVRWVYRHFPLTQIHRFAQSAAIASECAAEQGKFWEFTDRIFENQSSLGDVFYSQLAGELALDVVKFTSCVDDETYEEKVNSDLQDALRAGGQGTPFSVIITASGETIEISGAQPYQNVQALIEASISES